MDMRNIWWIALYAVLGVLATFLIFGVIMPFVLHVAVELARLRGTLPQ